MTESIPEVVDSSGSLVRLGRRIGRGGEGSVYDVALNPKAVAKIYHKPLDAERAAKIQSMVRMRRGQIEQLTAWPIAMLSAKTSRHPVGFLMPKLEGHKDAHHLYSPKSRRADFQQANWQFLVRAATNLSRAVACIHESGCVIGDVNPGGVQIGQDALVRLIDCDSFQFSDSQRRYLCHVGVPHFTPPELQGRDFAGTVRTPNNDNFGLAVLIFLMLFMGRHPFSGRYLGTGDMPLEKAIAEFRFVYSFRRQASMMEQPPGTAPISIASHEVSLLFERAFSKEGVNNTRPTAREWVTALEGLEKRLKQCANNPAHIHYSSLVKCPWCEMETATGIVLFPYIPRSSAAYFNLDELWRQVTSVAHPGPAPQIAATTMASFTPSLSAVTLRAQSRRWSSTILRWFTGKSAGVKEIVRHRLETRTRWEEIEKEWHEKTGTSAFDIKWSELENLRKQLVELGNVRARRLQVLHNGLRASQLEAFLDRHEIPARGISGIGPALKATLESYGIETAADIIDQKITGLPGIGPAKRKALKQWRASIEVKFRFDATKGIAPQDQAKVEHEISSQRQRLVVQLQRALAELKQINAQILTARSTLKAGAEQAYAQYLQAAVNAQTVGE